MVLTPCVTFVTIFIRAFIRVMYLYTALQPQTLKFVKTPENFLQATFDFEQSCGQKFFAIPISLSVTVGVKTRYTSRTSLPVLMVNPQQNQAIQTKKVVYAPPHLSIFTINGNHSGFLF